MNTRQQSILNTIVKEFIETAEPVGSLTLVENYDFPFSPATIRAEMSHLEDEGYIYQPYTSAGRIPTDKGYRFYVDNLTNQYTLAKREQEAAKKRVLTMQKSYGKRLDAAASVLAEMTSLASLAGLRDEIYHYGIANILRQPEFTEIERAQEFGYIFDHLYDLISAIPQRKETLVLIGEESPIGKRAGASIVVSRFLTPFDESGYLGVLGPTRMPYERNISLVNELASFLEEI